MARYLGFAEEGRQTWLVSLLTQLSGIKYLAPELLDYVAKSFPVVVGFVFGAWGSWFSLRKPAEALYARAFEQFDDGVLTRIAAPRAFDPLRGAAAPEAGDIPMPWVLGKDGPRRDAWRSLTTFATAGTESERGRPAVPFGWTILLGRSGSGKSRLGLQFGRDLAQRAIYGGDGRDPRRRPLSTWWRIQVLRARIQSDDPWDAGWLRPGSGTGTGAYPGWTGRQSVQEGWFETLASWRPRRSTFLLLDDPLIEDARRIVERLENMAVHFRHPVRLLIVNQTAPRELGLVGDGNAWISKGRRPPLVPPIAMTDDGTFTEQDIRALRGSGILSGRYPIQADADVRRFLARTGGGNPLLVEIGLAWLRAGRYLVDISEEALVVDRVERLFTALELAGLDTLWHHCALAVATLAAGETGADKDAVTAVFPLRDTEPEKLRRVFPVDTVDLRKALPPIRPEPIADGFVRAVFAKASDGDRQRIVATAWRANPAGMLRTTLRLGGRADELGTALAGGPPDDVALPRLPIALAYAEATLLLPPGAQAESPAGLRAAALTEASLAQAAKVSAEDGPALLDGLLSLAEPDNGLRGFCAQSWVRHVGKALEQAAPVMASDVDRVVGFIARLAGPVATRLGSQILVEQAAAGLAVGWTALAGLANWEREGFATIVRAFDRAEDGVASPFSAACAHAALIGARLCQPDLGRDDGDTLAALAWLCRSMGSEIAGGIAEEVESVVGEWPPGPSRTAARCRYHAAMAGAAHDSPHFCRVRAETVESMTAPFPEDNNLQRLRAEAWGYVAYATKDDRALCRSHAELVERIAEPFSQDRNIQFQRANAWGYVAYATKDDRASCHSHAAWIEHIAEPFPQDRVIQLERTGAWRIVSYATIDDFDVCRAHAETIERIAAPFSRDRNIQLQRLQAWRHLCYATKEDYDVCRTHAETVDRIAIPFPDDRDIQCQRAQAWRAVAYATRSDPALCRLHSETVERIAASYPVERDFQYERAHAQVFVADATTRDPALCRLHVETVDRLAALFPQDRDFQYLPTVAWRIAAYSTSDDRKRCYSNAEAVDRVAAPFVRDRDFQFERVCAWKHVSFANRSDAIACRTHVERVERIAEPFPKDIGIQRQRAEAWRVAAFAARADPALCRSHAERVANIADAFPNDPDIEEERSKALSFAFPAKEPYPMLFPRPAESLLTPTRSSPAASR